MTAVHEEQLKVPCAHPECTCMVIPGSGAKSGGAEYCSETCADPNQRGCGHEGCPCNRAP